MKDEKKIIIPTGYMGSGSSAVTDLLSEIDGVNASKGSFEYVFLHCPNGVFDLEDKLLKGNNALRSDEALHSFANTMRQLYSKKYWWVGHYNVNVGEKFWQSTQEYLEKLVEFESEYYWYYQENVNWKMVLPLCFNKVLKVLSRGKLHGKKVVAYSPTWLSFVSPDRFYDVSQKYIYQIMDMLGRNESSIVLDQLLLPFNLWRMEKYFKEDAEVFVVERDPRDVFISNKYFWAKQNEPVAYPTKVEDFCEYYKKMRNIEKRVDNPHIHRIKFEDLIYKYDKVVVEIFTVLEWSESRHSQRRKIFNPEKSISNTQLFLRDEKYQKECMVIEKELKEYLYDFPYKILHDEKKVF